MRQFGEYVTAATGRFALVSVVTIAATRAIDKRRLTGAGPPIGGANA
ncbi:MAG: hypothetical protein U5L03_07375 [Burkholderiaceae bacterium]|nr:hypothetical protein [Burkholderiaceae bacterium]